MVYNSSKRVSYKLVAQLVGASASDLCRPERQGFEPRTTRFFLSVLNYLK